MKMKAIRTSRRKFLRSASAIVIGSAAFGFGLPDTSSQKKSKEDIFKQLDELVDKYLSRDGVYKYCPGVIKKALHDAAEIILEKS